jgi:hypothetical protein
MGHLCPKYFNPYILYICFIKFSFNEVHPPDDDAVRPEHVQVLAADNQCKQ